LNVIISPGGITPRIAPSRKSVGDHTVITGTSADQNRANIPLIDPTVDITKPF
jgi:hypothetical protein